jgi:ribose-phosphate pyrophosphokinase
MASHDHYRYADHHLTGPEPSGFNIRLITGTANPRLAEGISKVLGIPLESVKTGRFADGEIDLRIKNNVRGADVFVIQPCAPPDVNDNLMELLLFIHTLNLSSAKRITAIMPYYPYARQDRKTRPRVPISASVVAQLLETMGPHRIVTVDLHCGQIQGFFHSTPVDNLYAEAELLKYLESKNFKKDELMVVSPDAGGVTRATRVADRIGALGVVTILKRRTVANQVDSMQIVGDVQDKTCVIVDDIIDTAGTLTKAAALLKEKGAAKVIAFATHGVFSEPAMDRINQSVLDEVCVTDSIPQHENLKRCPKLRVKSLVHLLAEAVERLHHEMSLSALFEKQK